MRYLRNDGAFREWRHTFGPADLAALGEFLDAHGGSGPLRERPTIAIRHDIDHNLDHAVRFARWEAERGFRSSYFVRPGAWYSSEPGYADGLLELVALGHEVGLHNDCVALAWRDGDAVDGAALPAGFCHRAADLLRVQLAELRALGIEVVGTAAHGSGLHREHGIHNNDLWAAGWTPADFGLEYEAYHLHRSAVYVSDNRGTWQSLPRVEPGRPTHFLIHPCHWNLG